MDKHPILKELYNIWVDSAETLRSVGERMGNRSPQQVSYILRGSKDVRLSTVARLADALGYEIVLRRKDADS